MFLQYIFIVFFVLLLVTMLGLYFVKSGLQLQYLKIQRKQKPGPVGDFFRFSTPEERKERWEAFLMFPLMYAIVLDDREEKLLRIKSRIKKIHIALYFILILLIILGIYSEKVFP